MRVLLDNNVPIDLKRRLARPHNVLHCRDVGWEGLANGRLVRAADAKFEAMVTVDKSMPHQTPLTGLRLAVLVLDAGSNKVEDVLAFAERIREVLENAPPGQYTWVRLDVER